MKPQPCDSCPHLRTSERREFMPVVIDHWCLHGEKEWLGFSPQRSGDCLEGQWREGTPAVQQELFA